MSAFTNFIAVRDVLIQYILILRFTYYCCEFGAHLWYPQESQKLCNYWPTKELALKEKKKTGFIQQVVAIEIKIVSRRFCFKKFRWFYVSLEASCLSDRLAGLAAEITVKVTHTADPATRAFCQVSRATRTRAVCTRRAETLLVVCSQSCYTYVSVGFS